MHVDRHLSTRLLVSQCTMFGISLSTWLLILYAVPVKWFPRTIFRMFLIVLLKAIVHGYLLRNLGARLPVSQYSVHKTSTVAQDSSNCYISASWYIKELQPMNTYLGHKTVPPHWCQVWPKSRCRASGVCWRRLWQPKECGNVRVNKEIKKIITDNQPSTIKMLKKERIMGM